MGCLMSRNNGRGSKIRRNNRIRSICSPPTAAPPTRTTPELIPGSNPPAASPSDAVSSVDFQCLSLESLSTVTEFMPGNNEFVVQAILQNKREIWKNQELSDLVEDYFKISRLTLDFCSSLEACLTRISHVESIINLALRKFHEEHRSATEEGSVKNYSNTLEELRNFRTAEDPFTQEFFKVLNLVSSHQQSMMVRLQAKKKKLDKKLRRVKAWSKISNAIYWVVMASVLIVSVVAAVVVAPPVVTALTAAALVPLAPMGEWIKRVWKKYEKDLMGQREIICTMQIGSYVVVNDLNSTKTLDNLDSIKRLVDKFQIQIEAMQANTDFATGEGEEAVVIAVEEIKNKMDAFINTIRDLREQAAKCNDQTRRARTVILKSIMRHPRSSE